MLGHIILVKTCFGVNESSSLHEHTSTPLWEQVKSQSRHEQIGTKNYPQTNITRASRRVNSELSALTLVGSKTKAKQGVPRGFRMFFGCFRGLRFSKLPQSWGGVLGSSSHRGFSFPGECNLARPAEPGGGAGLGASRGRL